MEKQQNKYTYLTEYEIEQVKKESKEEILDRLNNKEQKYKRLLWENQHYGKASIIIYKNGAQIQSINFDERDTNNGFMFNELKGLAQNLEQMYQDYESIIHTKIILSETWDETEQPDKTPEQ